MKKRIYIDVPLKENLLDLLNAENIEIVTNPPFDIKIIQSNECRESDLDTIYSGGWIACEVARSAAKKIEMPLSQMGKMLDCLNIKIRRCSLGCFR